MRVCSICGKELTGKQRKFCGYNCKNKDYYNKNKAELIRKRKDYAREYYRRVIRDKNKICAICGNTLPLNKIKYCSHKCYLRGSHQINYHITPRKFLELPKKMPLYCDECGGRIILNDHDIFCSKCGLVVE